MNPEIENEIRKELVKQIEEEVTLDKNPVWGHGTTSAETAEKILEEGIVVSKNFGIQEMAYPITDNSKSPEENANNIVERSLTWQHKDSKFLVLISIPETINRKEELTEDIALDTGQEKRRLPARFIKGYIDALNLKFVSNPKYEANGEPTKQELISTELPKPKQGAKIEIPQAAESESGNTGDVW